MKNHALKSAAQFSATPNKYCNLKTSKMGKTWHFIFSSVDKLSRYSKETKKKTQIKLLSHKINKNTT
jgi:hypothetical protein